LRPIDGRHRLGRSPGGPREGERRVAQAARTAIEMVWQEESLIVRCHSPSIEEDRHGREIEETPCAQHRFPGIRGKGADAQLEGEETEEDVAREVASSGLQRSPDAAGGVAGQNELRRYVSSGSSLSSHSRQTQPGSRAIRVLSSAGTIVTPQKAQIGGRSSSSLPSTASTIREGSGETIGEMRRHSSSSSASSLSHVCS
jgi:hypothetical protein